MPRTALQLLLLSAALAFSPACGKKKIPSSISVVGVDSIDSFFAQVADVDKRLDSARKSRKQGRQSLAKALKAEEDASFSSLLADLKAKGKNQIKAALVDGRVKLTAADMAPADVKNGVEATNNAVDSYMETLTSLKGIGKEAKQLAAEATNLSTDLPADAKGTSLSDLAGKASQLKTLRDNLRLTANLPQRSATIVTNLRKDLSLVGSTFGVEWTPGR